MRIIHPINLMTPYKTRFLKISMLFYKVALPSLRMISTHLIDSSLEENGALKAASAELKDIPISAYFTASQSLAPSPIIPTLKPCPYNISITFLFYSDLILANTLVYEKSYLNFLCSEEII